MTYRKPKGRFFWLPLAKYIKHPILLQTKRTVPLIFKIRTLLDVKQKLLSLSKNPLELILASQELIHIIFLLAEMEMYIFIHPKESKLLCR